MAYIIVESCIGTKDASCVNVCPVDCIRPRKDESDFEASAMLYIDPDTCIDCGACVPECPVTAIFPEADVADNMKQYIDMNRDWYKMPAAEFQAMYNKPGKTA